MDLAPDSVLTGPTGQTWLGLYRQAARPLNFENADNFGQVCSLVFH